MASHRTIMCVNVELAQNISKAIQFINCSRNYWKVILKHVQYVCHSAGLLISDVVSVHRCYDQWTSETARTTRPRLPLSAIPQFQTVITIQWIHSLLQSSPHCIIYQVQAGHISGSIKLTFHSVSSWWCLAVFYRSTLFEFISVAPS